MINHSPYFFWKVIIMESSIEIKAIIGLGNPGPKYYYNRHTIGFRVIDVLCDKYQGSWQNHDKFDSAQINIQDKKILLIKPTTFMNLSGEVIPSLQKKGICCSNILVIHDELELPFGNVKFKIGGSSRGHNGLKSIISFCGQDFARLRIGISRPENKDMVPNYVLQNFTEEETSVEKLIHDALSEIEKILFY